MAVSLKHAFTSNVSDSGDATLVQPSNWNAEHNLTAAANTLLGAVTTGNVVEITCTSAGRALLDDADAATQRTTLGLGTSDRPSFAGLDANGYVTGNVTAVAALDINCTLGNYFTKTINANSTFTFSNAPSAKSYSFTLELTQTSGAVTWPTAVKWPGGVTPSLTTGFTHLFMFVTDDAGTTWRGASLTNYTS